MSRNRDVRLNLPTGRRSVAGKQTSVKAENVAIIGGWVVAIVPVLPPFLAAWTEKSP
jgi:hypothetical protein